MMPLMRIVGTSDLLEISICFHVAERTRRLMMNFTSAVPQSSCERDVLLNKQANHQWP